MLLLSWQLVVPIGLLRIFTPHPALSHCFCFSKVAGRGPNTLRLHTVMIFKGARKHSARRHTVQQNATGSAATSLGLRRQKGLG